jgi:hypothetical protein
MEDRLEGFRLEMETKKKGKDYQLKEECTSQPYYYLHPRKKRKRERKRKIEGYISP